MKTLKRTLDKEITKKNYKNVAWFYDLWSWLTESKAAKKALSFAEISDGEKVLEIACGTGIVFEKILNSNPNGKNIGVDLSPDMISIAHKRLKANPNQNFQLFEADVLNLDFADNEFDLLINNFMIDLMPEEIFDKIADELEISQNKFPSKVIAAVKA